MLDAGNPALVVLRAALLEELGLQAWKAGVAADGRLLDRPPERAAEALRLLAATPGALLLTRRIASKASIRSELRRMKQRLQLLAWIEPQFLIEFA